MNIVIRIQSGEAPLIFKGTQWTTAATHQVLCSLVPRPGSKHGNRALCSEQCKIIASFPGIPGTQICICGENLVSFLCKHEVIKIGPEQKSNIFAHCSTNYAFNAQCV